MGRNQGWNVAGIIAGGALFFGGGIRGWDNMEQAEVLRGREIGGWEGGAETVVHFIGDPPYIR